MKHMFKISVSAAAAALFLGGVTAEAQQDPSRVGQGQLPYVLVLVDTSASVEWTDEGDDAYPTKALSLIPTWTPTSDMEIDGAPGGGPSAFGPCQVWEHETNFDGTDWDCSDYIRPSWRPKAPDWWGLNEPPSGDWFPFGDDSAGTFDSQQYRYWTRMRGNLFGRDRLSPNSQPRHVTIKEVMTGDMILFPNTHDPSFFTVESYNSALYGPGCWFVPRQYGASLKSLQEDEQFVCGKPGSGSETEFKKFPDHEEVRPHFQEVYDAQLSNGVMDRLSTNALFAVAMFDGFNKEVDGWPDKLNDKIDGSAPAGAWRGGDAYEGYGDCNTQGDGYCYDQGVYRIVTPKNLNIPTNNLPELSAFTQIALADAGYLHEGGGSEWELSPKDKESRERAWMGATFSKGFEKYIDKYTLGKQPIAKATPLAAAMHDIHQFFQNGQNGKNPFEEANDDFFECRPKHVVVLTDGTPAPERTGYGSQFFNEGFDYDDDRYTYDNTEEEIELMVTDAENKIPPSSTDPLDEAMFNPRVHIVGINVSGGDPQAIDKLRDMAIAGKTCAGAYLSGAWKAGGGCVPIAGVKSCLVDQNASGYVFEYPDGSTVDCDYPALILNDNNTDQLAAALFEIFSNIIGAAGVSSRTRAVVTSNLDDFNGDLDFNGSNDGGRQGGQFRFFSGVLIGGSTWWKGIINRNAQTCTGDPVAGVSLDDQVGNQVILTGTPRDSRRIFTSIVHPDAWNYLGNTPQLDVIDDTFINNFKLYDAGGTTEDEFLETYLAPVSSDDLLGKRIPFELDRIKNAVQGGGMVPDVVAHLNAIDGDEAQNIIDTFRGRIPDRVSIANGGLIGDGRAIGGILNSNPVVVGPPELDLPIGSYREFRAKFGDRPTMLYVSSMDGLLHAIHTGDNEGRIKLRALKPANGAHTDSVAGAAQGAELQREAWAYVPQMLHRTLASNTTSQPYLFDGSPVVKDVRLCNADPLFNQNVQVCTVACKPGSCDSYPPERQWRTVLVQGRGLAGDGYYAMDVTRPGGLVLDAADTFTVENPDPIAIWEFDRLWEERQVNYYIDKGREEYVDAGVNPSGSYDGCGGSDFPRQGFLGLSVSEPEIATLLVNYEDGGTSQKIQRPVAVFGGGVTDPDFAGCASGATGMAIYVVDLQTGTLLRRFLSYTDENGNEVHFAKDNEEAMFVGSPALFDGASGAVATRGFIGDARGRLFRIDLLNPDPTKWEVSLFFDPANDSDMNTKYGDAGFSNEDWGPAAYRPSIAVNSNKEVVVIYGLGEVGDLVANDQVQAVIALKEDFFTRQADLRWAEVFSLGEKLTGSPVIFDRAVYFPTYVVPDADVCEPGTSRIWNVDFSVSYPLGATGAQGLWQNNASVMGDPDITLEGGGDPTGDGVKYFETLEKVIIRGLTLTLGPQCAADGGVSDVNNFNTSTGGQPQLIAQASGEDIANSFNNADTSGVEAVNTIDRMVIDIPQPKSATIPLSWTILQ